MRALTCRSYLGQCPDPRGKPPPADPLLWGALAPVALQQASVYTPVESELWSYMVNGREVSFDRSVPWAEGLAFGPKSVRDSRYWGELRFNGWGFRGVSVFTRVGAPATISRFHSNGLWCNWIGWNYFVTSISATIKKLNYCLFG